MEYSNAQLLDMLLELDTEEIVKVDEEFKAEHPDCPTLSFICHMALGMKLKKDDTNRGDLVALIQKAKAEKKGSLE
ncbi:hypothetical protein [Hominisplanchenecus murintestinalis]|uniref:hypothetical protein n=1 Tax=Hominisplanchenecus murintestinalis TaxID=2941517 RepID=UPI00203D64F8|nr:hypothetical protein [Hominisplanchenecus murintestinalis]